MLQLLLSPRYVAAALFVALLLALGGAIAWGGHQKAARLQAEAKVLELRLEHEKQASAAQAAAREAETRYRALEQRFTDAVRKAEKEYQDVLQKYRRALDGSQRDADSLRSQLAAADAAAAAAQDPIAACREQSSARGDLLEEALRLSAELAAAAEDHAAAVRALQRSWPAEPAQP